MWATYLTAKTETGPHKTFDWAARWTQKHNFVVKCEGTAWCGTNILRNLEYNVGAWHIISALSEKVGGRVPRVPHLIAPMVGHSWFSISKDISAAPKRGTK